MVDKRWLAAVLSALFLLGAVQYVSFRTTASSFTSARALADAYRTIAEARGLLAELKTAESGRRGFALTGDASFLEQYRAALRDMAPRLSRLSALRSTQPGDGDWGRLLTQLIQKKVEHMDRSIALKQARPADMSSQAAMTKKGYLLQGQIDEVLGRLEVEEEAAIHVGLGKAAEDERAAHRVIGLGAVTGLLLLGAAAWISRQRRLESDEHNRFLDSVIENLPDMLFVKDAKSLRFVRFNRAGERLLGRGRDTLIGRSDYDFFPKEEADHFTAKDREVLASGSLLDIPEEPIQTPSGKRYLRTKKIPISGADGRPRFLLGISEDITELRQVEVKQKELAAMMTHELRSPISAVVLAFSILENQFPKGIPAEARRILDAAAKNSERVLRLIEDFFDLEKLEYGEVRFEIETKELAPIVDATLEAVRPLAQRSGVHLSLVRTRPRAAARVDASRFQQVLSNLLTNAVKFSPKEGVVEVSLERREGRLRVSVQDHGPGIPEDFRRRIFQKFARGDYARGEQRSGTGLGLSISKAIVERMGGTIGFETVPGEGTTFHFELPEDSPPTADR